MIYINSIENITIGYSIFILVIRTKSYFIVLFANLFFNLFFFNQINFCLGIISIIFGFVLY